MGAIRVARAGASRASRNGPFAIVRGSPSRVRRHTIPESRYSSADARGVPGAASPCRPLGPRAPTRMPAVTRQPPRLSGILAAWILLPRRLLGTLIENWHLSDFHISRARPEQEAGYAEHLSREGENLSLVIEYLHKQHPKVFAEILKKLASRVPGITSVESKVTEEGRVLLKFQDGSFQDPFLARYVSDGTIKMLAYLVLLLDPKPHPLLCVEEPENQLYPALLSDLAEEFRSYATRGGQVFVSTHSPDFLNAIETEEAFWLVKNGGYTEVRRAKDDVQITAYMNDGDKLGYLWKQGLFEGADPR